MPKSAYPTRAAAACIALAQAAGYTDYDVHTGRAKTLYVHRLQAPNGRIIVVQHGEEQVRVWLLPEHDEGHLSALGSYIIKPNDDRHSGLRQVREFKDQSLMKVIITSDDAAAISRALTAIGARKMAA